MQTPFHKARTFLAASMSTSAGALSGLLLGQSAIGHLFPGLISAAWWVLLALSLLAVAGYRPPVKSLSDKAFFLLSLFLCSLVLGSSVSAACLHPGEDWWYRLAGFVPHSDARGFYKQVLSWPAEHFIEQSSRRPWNAVFDICVYHLAGSSLLVFFLIQSILTAGAITALVTALSMHVGRLPAWLAGNTLLYFAWPQVSLLMTEINGIIFTALGIALLLYGLATEKKWLLVWGIIGISISCQLRPFNPAMPYFFLAAVVALAPVAQRKLRLFLLLTAVVIAFSVVVPRAIFAAYAHPETVINGNISATLLGLARGTNWWEARLYAIKERDNAGASGCEGCQLTEREMYDSEMSLLLPTILDNPSLIIRSLIHNFSEALKQYYKASLEMAGLERLANGQFKVILLPLFYAFIILLPMLLLRRHPAMMSMFLLTLLSFISFAPVVYGDGGWRIVAPLFPGLALFPVLLPLGLEWLLKRPGRQIIRTEVNMSRIPGAALARGLVIAMLVLLPYPGLVKLFSPAGGDPAQDVLEVRLDDSVRPGWTGFNSAVASRDVMATWIRQAEREQFGGYDWSHLARYFTENRVNAVRAEAERIVLVMQDSAAAAEYPDSTKVPIWFSQVSVEVAADQ